ncbi:reverse transcriptase [Plakobranchus ocellatus]|uniref:Reverse transcriptase n=1 Tax=Plakobranchus ocellatus TaxID=259542 RepID=A0AAV3Y2J1_9GAST|nr:reverse transcriptase [Plakobranchus ocellatus]
MANNRVLQEFAIAICDAKCMPDQPKARAQVFTPECGTKSWCGGAAGMDTLRQSLLDVYDDWDFSADLSECSKHPKVIQGRNEE